MPISFFGHVWPLATGLILLSGLIISLAALTTLVNAISRARQYQHDRLSGEHPNRYGWSDPFNRQTRNPSEETVEVSGPIVDTQSADGVHYWPLA